MCCWRLERNRRTPDRPTAPARGASAHVPRGARASPGRTARRRGVAPARSSDLLCHEAVTGDHGRRARLPPRSFAARPSRQPMTRPTTGAATNACITNRCCSALGPLMKRIWTEAVQDPELRDCSSMSEADFQRLCAALLHRDVWRHTPGSLDATRSCALPADTETPRSSELTSSAVPMKRLSTYTAASGGTDSSGATASAAPREILRAPRTEDSHRTDRGRVGAAEAPAGADPAAAGRRGRHPARPSRTHRVDVGREMDRLDREVSAPAVIAPGPLSLSAAAGCSYEPVVVRAGDLEEMVGEIQVSFRAALRCCAVRVW